MRLRRGWAWGGRKCAVTGRGVCWVRADFLGGRYDGVRVKEEEEGC
jgi:hypothetical protein